MERLVCVTLVSWQRGSLQLAAVSRWTVASLAWRPRSAAEPPKGRFSLHCLLFDICHHGSPCQMLPLMLCSWNCQVVPPLTGHLNQADFSPPLPWEFLVGKRG